MPPRPAARASNLPAHIVADSGGSYAAKLSISYHWAPETANLTLVLAVAAGLANEQITEQLVVKRGVTEGYTVKVLY